MQGIPFTVQFGSSGDYKMWAGDGWHHDVNDPTHTWTSNVAKLHLMVEHTGGDLLLAVDVIPVQARGVEQELFVFLNGAFVAYWPVGAAGTKSARIEANFLAGRTYLITFLAPKSICPREAGLGNDERVLGLAYRSLTLSAIK